MGPDDIQPPVGGTEPVRDRWKFRRRLIFITAGAAVAGILAIGLWGDPNNAIHTALVGHLMLGLWGVIAFYIGAPVADDWLQAKSGIVGKANDLLQERNAILSNAPRGGASPNALG